MFPPEGQSCRSLGRGSVWGNGPQGLKRMLKVAASAKTVPQGLKPQLNEAFAAEAVPLSKADFFQLPLKLCETERLRHVEAVHLTKRLGRNTTGHCARLDAVYPSFFLYPLVSFFISAPGYPPGGYLSPKILILSGLGWAISSKIVIPKELWVKIVILKGLWLPVFLKMPNLARSVCLYVQFNGWAETKPPHCGTKQRLFFQRFGAS